MKPESELCRCAIILIRHLLLLNGIAGGGDAGKIFSRLRERKAGVLPDIPLHC